MIILILSLLFSLISQADDVDNHELVQEAAVVPPESLDDESKNPTLKKTGRLHPYLFQEMKISLPPLNAGELCKQTYGQTAKPGKKFPFENTEDLVVINCFVKNNSNVKQIPIEKETLENMEILFLNEKCKVSTPYHDNELAAVVRDNRDKTDLVKKYFGASDASLDVRCRRPNPIKANNSFYKEKSRQELMIEAFKSQQKRKRAKNALKKAIEDGKKPIEPDENGDIDFSKAQDI